VKRKAKVRAKVQPPARSKPSTKSLRSALLAWYDRSARDLPWRRTRDPYAIWVSEVMLQQTRVETVLRYYDRFLERFPTPNALASASEDAVLAAWSGLGYYRRARNLHLGVREVLARYGGSVPEEPEQRRSLPGVGRYTAGAIGSIAFDRAEPIVDGNVARVLCRLHVIEGAPGQRAVDARLWSEAEALARGPRPGALNQALMELGATVCTKHAPRCEACPVAHGCGAREKARVGELPAVRARKPPRRWPRVGLVATLEHQGEACVVLTRSEEPLFGGLWNLPMADGDGLAVARALCRTLGSNTVPEPLGRLSHLLSHRAIELELYQSRLRSPPRKAGTQAVALRGLHGLGISSLTRKALAKATSELLG
jgi:A/G-specific adenine glycosylase